MQGHERVYVWMRTVLQVAAQSLSQMKSVLIVGKRHYTNQDALTNRFGRVYWIPKVWHDEKTTVRLVMIDYHGLRRASTDDDLAIHSVSVFDPRSAFYIVAAAKAVRADTVIASGDCMLGLASLWLARRLRAKFVFDVYDDYRVFGAYRVFLGWDALSYLCRRADLVTYASEAMAARHNFESPHTVVPNGFDGEQFRPIPRSVARATVGLSSAGRLVGYFGSMTYEHGVHVLVEAVARLREHHKDVQLLLCGKRHPAIVLSAEGIIYRGLVPHEMIPSYLNACDVVALPYLRGPFIDNASSCKIAEYLACRRPLVATRSPNFTENFPEQARQLDSLLAPPGDSDALAQVLERQLTRPEVVEPPMEMTWQQIAARLRRSIECLAG